MSIPQSQHQQYSVIVALSQIIQQRLKEASLIDAYTLSKDELVMVFKHPSQQIYAFKIAQQFQSCFVFWETFAPEKGSNAQPCFESIFGQPIQQVRQHHGNRSFAIVFDDEQELVFKMYDGLVNVLLFTQLKVTDMFRQSIANDWKLSLASFAEPGIAIEQPVNRFYVYQRSHPHPYYFSITPQSDSLVFESGDVLEALTDFSKRCLAYYRFASRKQQLLSNYTAEYKKLETLLHKTRKGLSEKQTEITAEEIGHIIMANLHAIPTNSIEVELFDFYRNIPITVQLKKELNAQQNAAYYYRKHKNSAIELEQLAQKLKATEDRLEQVKKLLSDIQNVTQYRELKPFLPKEKVKKQTALPFRQFDYEGFLIWVGKSAANNDELTLRHSHKNDLWLHAKDVAGSHVLVKWKAGKPFPPNVVERAAQLAAYYSKLKGSTLVPVSYTLKKFVRKAKGAEPGQVIVEKEDVLMVEPKITE